MTYDKTKAALAFSYLLNSTCDPVCESVNVQLYRDNESSSSTVCTAERTINVMDMEQIGADKNVTQGPVRYIGIDTGCYWVEVKPLVHPLPERTPLLWLLSAIHVPDMTHWNTTFTFMPDPERHALTVRWLEAPAYNFTAYTLTLHHHPTVRLACTGRGLYRGITVIPQGKLVVRKPVYTFYNLSTGWYCARVTPQDDRCPLDGCTVLSSPPVHLKEPLSWRCQEDPECVGEGGGVVSVVLVVLGCVLGAVLTGVMVTWAILHSWPTLSTVFGNGSTNLYSPVPARPSLKGPIKRPIVLVVWTPQGLHGARFGPIVAAFKTILRTYSHCEVYDYLELSSLPERHQLTILESPTTWLDSLLAQHAVKIIIIATEGAWQRLVEWRGIKPSLQAPIQSPSLHQSPNQAPNPALSAPNSSLDDLLFPYLLRRLHDQPELAGDYSRLFHVRFSEVSHGAVELGNLVSWTRYKIPEHLHSLTLALHHGGTTTTTTTPVLDEPTDLELKELRSALSRHPQYTGPSTVPNASTGTSIWPDLVTHTGQVTLGNGATGNKI